MATKKKYDLSQYAPPVDEIDLSHLAPKDESKEDLLSKFQYMAEEQKAKPEPYKPQPQEEFSNPTQFPGFEKLPKDEQQRRIAFSQFAPSNVDATGRYVPPGTWEHPVTRMAASIAPTLATPELGTMGGFFSRNISPIINTLMRIGSGTASNVAYESPNINSLEKLKDVAKQGLKANAFLESIPFAARATGKLAEVYNPVKFAEHKANQIRNEVKATEQTMEEMYKPVKQKYDEFNVTLNPKQYLKDTGIKRESLYPEAQEIYDKVIKEPTFKNVHDLQSRLGKDWAFISNHPATFEKAQEFKIMRQNLKDKIQNFLSHDKEALTQYNAAANFGHNVHYPYLSTPTLRAIAKGQTKHKPETIAKSINSGIKKTLGKEEKSLIPEGHALRNHVKELENALSRGKMAQYLVPTIAGGALGELAHPGLAGTALGGTSLLGASQLAKIASHYGAPSFTKVIQDQLTKKLTKGLEPIYYGAGRAGINAFNEDNQ